MRFLPSPLVGEGACEGKADEGSLSAETDRSPVSHLRCEPPSPQGEREQTRAVIAPQLRHAPADRRGARRARRARSRPTTPPCWSRRPAPARPRACRWRCSMSPGWTARRSSCWSRGGSRRAPAPSAWRRRWASGPARPSAIASASAQRFRARRGSRSSPKAFSRGRFSTIPNCPASPRCCSTNFTSARSMPIWGSRWRAMRRPACARICASW